MKGKHAFGIEVICLKNLAFVILCITCLNLFTDGRLFYHIESFFSPNYVYLDNDNIDDVADPLESHEDSFVLHIIPYDNDRKLYISLIPVSDNSGDDDCDNLYILGLSPNDCYTINRLDLHIGVTPANWYSIYIPKRLDSDLPSDAAGGGFIYGITMFVYNGAPDKWRAVFCTRI